MYIACLLLDFTHLAFCMCLVLVVEWSNGAVISKRDNQITWRKICASPPHILLAMALNSKQKFHRLSKDTTFNPVELTINTISSLNSNIQNEPLGFIRHA